MRCELGEQAALAPQLQGRVHRLLHLGPATQLVGRDAEAERAVRQGKLGGERGEPLLLQLGQHGLAGETAGGETGDGDVAGHQAALAERRGPVADEAGTGGGGEDQDGQNVEEAFEETGLQDTHL